MFKRITEEVSYMLILVVFWVVLAVIPMTFCAPQEASARPFVGAQVAADTVPPKGCRGDLDREWQLIMVYEATNHVRLAGSAPWREWAEGLEIAPDVTLRVRKAKGRENWRIYAVADGQNAPLTLEYVGPCRYVDSFTDREVTFWFKQEGH